MGVILISPVKMKGLLCIVVAVFMAAFASADECQKKEMKCGMMLTSLPQAQPSSQEEIQKYCGLVQGYVSCIEGAKAECPNVDSNTAESMKNAIGVMCGGSGGPSGGPSGGSGGMADSACKMMKLKECSDNSGIDPTKKPSEEDFKNNKDGVCDKVMKFQKCIAPLKKDCKDTQGVSEMIKGMKMFAKICEKAKKDAEGSATSVQLSSFLLLVIPAFLMAWM